MLERTTVFKVNYSKLEEFLSKTFNRQIELIAPMNDVYNLYKVAPFSNIPESYDQVYNVPEYENFKSDITNTSIEDYELGTILNGLCTEGNLVSGEYLVEFSW